VTKVGFTVMIQKQSNNCHSGTAHNHQEQKKVQQVPTKSMVIVFFYVKGIIHHEFVPPNTMFNSDFYCDLLRHLRKKCADEKDQNFGAITTGSFITTLHLPIHP
jgi:hypothetical protein